MTVAPAVRPRLDSVDALRGLSVAAMLLVNTPGDWNHVFAPLRHAQWHGCTPTDLIFPFFLFVAGVSLALSAGDAAPGAAGPKKGTVPFSLLRRCARLMALGLVLNLAAHWAFDTEHFRIPGVLQRIGLCVLAIGTLVRLVSERAQWIALGLLLLGYWALLAAGGTYAPELNLASRLDTALLGPFNYAFDPATGRGHDPEGLLSTLGACGTTLLGYLSGWQLRRGNLRRLALLGVICLAVGAAWSAVLPLNKNLWTPSYVLWSGGWAIACLLLMHLAVERARLPAWGRTFGVNAIAIYAGAALLISALAGLGLLDPAYRTLFAGWVTPLFGPKIASLTFALAYVLLWWGVARALDRRRVYVRI